MWKNPFAFYRNGVYCLGKRGKLSLPYIFAFMVTAVWVVLPNIKQVRLILE